MPPPRPPRPGVVAPDAPGREVRTSASASSTRRCRCSERADTPAPPWRTSRPPPTSPRPVCSTTSPPRTPCSPRCWSAGTRRRRSPRTTGTRRGSTPGSTWSATSSAWRPVSSARARGDLRGHLRIRPRRPAPRPPVDGRAHGPGRGELRDQLRGRQGLRSRRPRHALTAGGAHPRRPVRRPAAPVAVRHHARRRSLSPPGDQHHRGDPPLRAGPQEPVETCPRRDARPGARPA